MINWHRWIQVPSAICAVGKAQRLQDWINESTANGVRWIRITPLDRERVVVVFPSIDFPIVVRAWRKTRIRQQQIPVERDRLKFTPVMIPPWRQIQQASQPWLWISVTILILSIVIWSSLLWRIEIRGGSVEARAHVQQLLKREGIRVWVWRTHAQLAEPDKLSRHLLERVPGLSWVTVKQNGAKLVIELDGLTTPKPSATSHPLKNNGPVDLIANRDAMIARLDVNRGLPMVRRYDHVHKGQLLVSGTIGAEQRLQTIGAEGHVFGYVWYEVQVQAPIRAKLQGYTGVRKQSVYWYIGNWVIGRDPSASGGVIKWRRQPVRIWTWTLPFGWVEEQRWQTVTTTITRKREDVIHRAKQLAAARLRERAGSMAKMRLEKILHVKWDRDKVNLTMLYEMEEPISAARPAVIPSASPAVTPGMNRARGAQPTQ